MAKKTTLRGIPSMKDERRLIELAKAGASTEEAAAKLGTSAKTIQRIASGLGIKFDGGKAKGK